MVHIIVFCTYVCYDEASNFLKPNKKAETIKIREKSFWTKIAGAKSLTTKGPAANRLHNIWIGQA